MTTEDLVQKVVEHLEKSLMEDLKDHIKSHIKLVVQSEFKELNDRIARLERTMDTWKNDLDEDRSDLKAIRKNSEYMNTDLQEVSKTVDKLPKKIENTVNETLPNAVSEAIPKAVNDTFQIFGKKVKVIEKPESILKKITPNSF